MQVTPVSKYKVFIRLIYLYIFLLFFEGAFRKWITPGLNTPLLIIRDPIAVLIYILAFRHRCFPVNYFITTLLILAFFSFALGMFSEHSNMIITAYGLRINYLHVPLIFIFPYVLTRENVYELGRFILWMTIPMTAVLLYQFYSPQTHWINHGPGGNVTIGLTGGLGRFRSSGTFSFVTGIAAFYPLAAAFLLAHFIERREMKMIFMAAFGVAIVLAVPCSMSRQLALTCAIVFLAGIYAMYKKKDSSRLIMRIMSLMALVVFAASFTPAFDEGVDSFSDRWEQATGDDFEDFNRNIMSRFSGSFTHSSDMFSTVQMTGIGVGMGSNVAAKLLTGEMGFLLAEDEWSRIMLELGPLLGLAFIVYRVALCIYLFKHAFASASEGNSLPLLILAALGLLVLNGQWAPPTILGFAVLGGGLVLAACNPPHETAEQKQKRRYHAHQFLNPAHSEMRSQSPTSQPRGRRKKRR